MKISKQALRGLLEELADQKEALKMSCAANLKLESDILCLRDDVGRAEGRCALLTDVVNRMRSGDTTALQTVENDEIEFYVSRLATTRCPSPEDRHPQCDEVADGKIHRRLCRECWQRAAAKHALSGDVSEDEDEDGGEE